MQRSSVPGPAWRVAALTVALAAVPAATLAEGDPGRGPERILNLDSDIQVATDGALRVRETIRIWSTGRQFVHGLERIFPETYAGPLGSRSEVAFHVEEAQCDGSAEPFTVRRSGRDVTVRIGQADVLLPPGEHLYRITYLTNRQLGFFRDHDELYWNAVGPSWRLPIDEASATVTLPPAAAGLARNPVAYIGRAGSRQRALRAAATATGGSFAAARPLHPGEGLTIVLEWPKGIVVAPPAGTRLGWWVRDNPDAVVALLGVLALAIFVRASRARLASFGPLGNNAQTVPPPEGIAALASPCLLRYVARVGFDSGSLPVAIMDMAERGHLTVGQVGAHYQLVSTGQGLDELPPEEQSTARALFEAKKEVELAPIDAPRLAAASTALAWDLQQRSAIYVVEGRAPALVGLLLALLVTGLVLGLATGDTRIAVFVGLWCGGLGIGLFAVLARLLRALFGREAKATSAIAVVMLMLLASVIGLFEVKMAESLVGERVTPLALWLTLGVLFLGHRSLRLWRIRTRAGERLYREARRLRRSLTASRRPAPDNRTGDAVSRLFPYALALDAVGAWEGVMARFNSDPVAPVARFRWLRVHAGWDRDPYLMTRSLSSITDELATTITTSTAAAPPGSSPGGSSSSDSSSSGSSDRSESSPSGGGSSGGGGGGGGGGGW